MTHARLKPLTRFHPPAKARRLSASRMVEVQPDRIGGGDNSSCNDVVAIQQGATDRFPNAIDIYWRCSNKGQDKDDRSDQSSGNQQYPKPPDIQPIFGTGNPVAESIPSITATAAFQNRSHNC